MQGARESHAPIAGNKRRKSLNSMNSMMEVMKKCRITVTPGELRIKADIAECRDLVSQGLVELEPNYEGSPSVVRITFLGPVAAASPRAPPPMAARSKAGRADTRPILATFIMSVPRYYPHDPPQVRCSSTFPAARADLVGSDGMVMVPPLGARSHWSSVMSLRDVLLALAPLLGADMRALPLPPMPNTIAADDDGAMDIVSGAT